MSTLIENEKKSILDQATIALIKGISPEDYDKKFGDRRVSARMGAIRYVETLFQCDQLEKREEKLWLKPKFVPRHLKKYIPKE